ncbi:hypothetical protein ACFLXC_01945 [Chloroflexota bacterium]
MNNLYQLGCRGRVGLVLPSVNTITEPVFYALAPDGISFHVSRTFITGTSVEDVLVMEKDKDRAVRELASARLDCIADCCTASGIIRGLETDRDFCYRVAQETSIPTTSTLQAILDALNVLKLRRLTIASPYPEAMDKLEKSFFEKNGFEVVNIKGLDIKEGYRLAQVPPDKIYRLCLDAWNPESDGLFINCMNFNATPVIQALEMALNTPVISSNSATLWKILHILGVKDIIHGYGRLLSECIA